jgi:hypothetical protein
MPTVDDFMSRFGGGGAIDDREAHQYYDRFASTHPDDRQFDNETMSQGATEYLGQLPDDEFQRAAINAYDQAPPQQRQGLLSGLLGSLQGRGVNPNSLTNQLGLSSLNPQQVGPNEFARLANFTRRNHPDVMREQVQKQPWIMKAMGNPILMGALGVVAARMMKKSRPQFA